MIIKRISFPVKVLGPGKRVGIWTCGCRFKCPGCMTPELQSFEAGNEMSVEGIISALRKIPHKIDGFTISGGEPFEQPDELEKLVCALCEEFTDDIIIYSGYTYDELLKKGEKCKSIFDKIAVLVDGRYIDELNDNKGLRGSANQNVIIFRDTERYSYMNSCKRELQLLNYGGGASVVFGIM